MNLKFLPAFWQPDILTRASKPIWNNNNNKSLLNISLSDKIKIDQANNSYTLNRKKYISYFLKSHKFLSLQCSRQRSHPTVYQVQSSFLWQTPPQSANWTTKKQEYCVGALANKNPEMKTFKIFWLPVFRKYEIKSDISITLIQMFSPVDQLAFSVHKK